METFNVIVQCVSPNKLHKMIISIGQVNSQFSFWKAYNKTEMCFYVLYSVTCRRPVPPSSVLNVPPLH